MKKESRKLNLNRETLITMQNDDLDLVYGGGTPVASVVVSARASSAACIRAATEGVKWVARTAARITSAMSIAYSAANRSRDCGPTHGGPQAPQGQRGGDGGGE